MRHLVTFKVAVAGAADNLGRLIIGKRAFDEKIDQRQSRRGLRAGRYCESLARTHLAAGTIHEKNTDSAKLWLVIRQRGRSTTGRRPCQGNR
jgi:hypothetical protein